MSNFNNSNYNFDANKIITGIPLENNSSYRGPYLNDSTHTRNKVANTSEIMLVAPINNSPNRSRSPSPSRPLLSIQNPNASAPLARMEMDDEHDNREVVHNPYPGVDDGFFSNGDSDNPKEEPENPDVEFIPTRPKDPEEIEPHIPDITPRLGPDGGSVNPEDTKPPTNVPKIPPPVNHPEFPQSPGFRPWGWDFEVGSTLPNGERIPDLNVYQHKKTLAQGMMDLALFSANANQLRYVVETFKTHPYYYPSVALIAVSLMLQVAVGIGLIWNATYNIKDQKSLCVANRVNNATTICVFLITVINVFISAFGVAPAPS